MTRSRNSLNFLKYLIQALLLFTLIACVQNNPEIIETSNDKTQPERPRAEVVLDGGADPSGGGIAQSSSNEELEKNIDLALVELPALFHRLQFWASHGNNLMVFPFLRVIKECNNDNSNKCTYTIPQVIQSFQEAYSPEDTLIEGDCPASLTNHTTTDMSVSKNLKLCISRKLKRYPAKVLKSQVIGLLAHEVVHGVRGALFDEPEAQAIQEFIATHLQVGFPGQYASKDIYDSLDLLSLGLAALTHNLSKSTDSMLTNFLVKKVKEDLASFNGDDGRIYVPIDERPQIELYRLLEQIEYWSESLSLETPKIDRATVIHKLREKSDDFFNMIDQMMNYFKYTHLGHKLSVSKKLLEYKYFPVLDLTDAYLNTDHTLVNNNYNALQCHLFENQKEIGVETLSFNKSQGYYTDSFYSLMFAKEEFQVEGLVLPIDQMLKEVGIKEKLVPIYVLLQRRVDDNANILIGFNMTFTGPVKKIETIQHNLSDYGYELLNATSPSTEAKFRLHLKPGTASVDSFDFRIKCVMVK